MTSELALTGEERVLEIGTGSGYQASVLAQIVPEVYTIEIKPVLYKRTRELLRNLGYEGIHTRSGDGYWGWEEAAPFDCIMITAAVDHIPRPLYEQLTPGGRLVLPLGHPFHYQNLVVVTKSEAGPEVRIVSGVRFVPMTGHALE
jgi:protein-L-isoaspartate(D-aspartate) O-methyltransferase